MIREPTSERPVILGGSPHRISGPPAWPVVELANSQEFLRVLQCGAWGRYHAECTVELTRRLQVHYQTEHVILTCSGTTAVELALRGLKIRPGDEVILSAYDFKSNFTNILLLGATPVLVDIRDDDGQLDVQCLHDAWTPRTRAIIASHLHGGIVDLNALQEFAKAHDLAIIEDCCQSSPRARVDDSVLGSHGDIAVLSFGGSKLLTAGRGGAVICRKPEVAQRIRLYTQRGNEAYPLSEIQAAVLLPQLEQLPELFERRTSSVHEIRTVTTDSGLTAFRAPAGSDPDFYRFGFFYDSVQFAGLTREHFCQSMRAEGIPLDPGFRALHQIHARSRFRSVGDLNRAGQADQSLVTLHHPFLLMRDAGDVFAASVARIQKNAEAIADWFRHHSAPFS